MERNQFFYTRKEPLPIIEGKEVQFKDFRDSFNVNKVIRSVALEDGRLLILLDDLHERIQEIPIKSHKGVITNIKRERNTFQSEIYLQDEDIERFYKLTNTEL